MAYCCRSVNIKHALQLHVHLDGDMKIFLEKSMTVTLEEMGGLIELPGPVTVTLDSLASLTYSLTYLLPVVTESSSDYVNLLCS